MWPFSQTAAVAEIEMAPAVTAAERYYVQLPAEIAAAKKELGAASLDENRYRTTHPSHEQIFNGQYQISMNAMRSDFADFEIQRRIRRTTAAKQRFCALLDEYTQLKKELGHATY